jgi:hypothetical protein
MQPSSANRMRVFSDEEIDGLNELNYVLLGIQSNLRLSGKKTSAE